MTILNALKFVGREHTRRDRQFIGYNVQQVAITQKVKPQKVKQEEDGKTYLVNNWPTEFEAVIFAEIDKHFLPKQAPPKNYPTAEAEIPVSIVKEAKPKRPRIKKGVGK